MKLRNIKTIGIISALIIVIISSVYFLIYQPSQKRNDLAMELKCKEIAESRYEKAKEVNKRQSPEPNIFMQHGYNNKLNTCIYSKESTWLEDEQYVFMVTVIDSVRNKVLLSGYYSDTYQKDVFKDHREDGREITADEYRRLKEELLDK